MMVLEYHWGPRLGCSCALTWSMHLIIFVNNAMRQAHGFVSLRNEFNGKPCAWLLALLTKIMRCIIQVRAQEQPPAGGLNR